MARRGWAGEAREVEAEKKKGPLPTRRAARWWRVSSLQQRGALRGWEGEWLGIRGRSR
jgi:hypothetical protein